jgi:hypothetical protein
LKVGFIAAILLVTGIAVIGVFTATVASFLFEDQQAQDPSLRELISRLESVEPKLDDYGCAIYAYHAGVAPTDRLARLKLLRELAVTSEVDAALPRVAPSYGVVP